MDNKIRRLDISAERSSCNGLLTSTTYATSQALLIMDIELLSEDV